MKTAHISLGLIPVVFSFNFATDKETRTRNYKLCRGSSPLILKDTSSGTFDIKTPNTTRYINCTWIINSVDYSRDLNFFFKSIDVENTPDGCVDKVTIFHNTTNIKTACGSTVPKDMSKTRQLVINQKAKSDPIEIKFETDIYQNLEDFKGFELVFQERKSKAIYDTQEGAEPIPEDKSNAVLILSLSVIALIILALGLFLKFRGADRSLNIFRSRVNEIDDTFPNVDISNINNHQRGQLIEPPTFAESQLQQGIYGGPIVRQTTEQTEVYQTRPLMHGYGDGEEVYLESRQRSISPSEVRNSTALSESTITSQLERSRQGTLPANSLGDYASFARPLPELPEKQGQTPDNDEKPTENDYVTQAEIDQMRSQSIQEARYGYAGSDQSSEETKI